MADPPLDALRHALDVARQREFAEVEVSLGAFSFEGVLEPRKAKSRRAASLGGAAGEPSEPTAQPIVSPVVGYYREGRVKLAEGATIQRGDLVAVIEALGLANDVESSVEGVVQEVLVQPGDPVDYGKVLARIKVPD